MSNALKPKWYVRPAIMLPFVAALVLLTAILTPEARSGRDGDERLTTYSHESQGASGVYEMAERLGWHTERRKVDAIDMSPNVIHALLDPAVPLRAPEVHALLEHARSGGALLVVLDRDQTLLADSLNLKLGEFGGPVAEPDSQQLALCGKETKLIGFVPLWPSNRASLYMLRWKKKPTFAVDTILALEALGRSTTSGPIRVTAARASSPDTIWVDSARFAEARRTALAKPTGANDSGVSIKNDSLLEFGDRAKPVIAIKPARDTGYVDTIDSVVTSGSVPRHPMAVIGFALGKGRVVVASDPDFLRNDALRVCRFGFDVAAVRALEFLRDGGAVPRKRLAFDEYHQRYDRQPGTIRTVAAFLSGTQWGHVLFQVLAAALVWLITMMPRPIPPRDVEQVERRSPLEHVDALARAYAQVGGTRTAVSLLVRGLRRRVERASSRSGGKNSNESFLDRLETINPALKSDIEVIRKGLRTQLSTNDFAQLGSAIKRVELSLARI